ncbi:MAG: DNA translocase FtsK, partial [Patescibacteria group bacterium]
VDSRTILDIAGAEKLLGNGDMLYMSNDSSKPRRLQGVFISEKEIKKIVGYVAEKNPLTAVENEEFPIAENNLSPTLFKKGGGEFDFSSDEFSGDTDDELFEAAKEVIFQAKKASASLLQRRLRVGYARAARLLDILEEKGFVGPGDGAKPREVYLEKFDPLTDPGTTLRASGQDKEDEI